MSPTGVSGSHVYPAFTFAVCGCVRCSIMVQSSVCPADPGGDAAANHQRANPATSPTDCLRPRAVCQIDCYPRPICLRQPWSPGGRSKGPLFESGKSSTGSRLAEAGAGVVDPRASVWKTHLCLAGLSGRSGLISLTPPTTVVRSTKTRLRTLMTPLSLLMGLSQVLPHLLWPPVPLVPLPRHPSDRWGVFYSVTPPCLVA